MKREVGVKLSAYSSDGFVDAGIYPRNLHSYWRVGYNHNQLRITRVIECLRLLVSDSEADKFYHDVLLILGPDIKINEHTFKFWKEA